MLDSLQTDKRGRKFFAFRAEPYRKRSRFTLIKMLVSCSIYCQLRKTCDSLCKKTHICTQFNDFFFPSYIADKACNFEVFDLHPVFVSSALDSVFECSDEPRIRRSQRQTWIRLVHLKAFLRRVFNLIKNFNYVRRGPGLYSPPTNVISTPQKPTLPQNHC